jgi:CxxC motif-containing protein (DUF1111 family)
MGTRKQSPATRVLADTDQTSEQRLVADADCKQQQLQFVVKKKEKEEKKQLQLVRACGDLLATHGSSGPMLHQ